jgi:hypothetical protein
MEVVVGEIQPGAEGETGSKNPFLPQFRRGGRR